MKRLILIGASGHGKVCADISRLNGYDEIIFLDNNEKVKDCGGYPVVGIDTATLDMDGDVFISIGKSENRKRLCEMYEDRLVKLIHPDAVIAEGVEIGKGSVVMAGAVINPGAVIGRGVIVNTSSSIDHDCKIGDYVHVAVGAHISGTVEIGDNTWLGIGSVVSNNVNICGNCIVGAGAVVIKDIETPGTYVGVPAKKLVNNNVEITSGGVRHLANSVL